MSDEVERERERSENENLSRQVESASALQFLDIQVKYLFVGDS
jgi:hypothetical protein